MLRAAGVTNASSVRFFTNALDTTTSGYEIVAAWCGPIARGADLAVNAAYSRSSTHVDAQRGNPTVPALPLLGTVALDLLTTAQPRDKIVGSAKVTTGPLVFGVDVVRFGSFQAVSVVQEQVYSPATTVDLTAEIKVADRFSLGVGVLNVGNAYPDKIADRALTQGGSIQYPEVGGLGTKGREFFARATVRF